MPALDGNTTVFGVAVRMTGLTINPRRDQKANYAGLNGTESIDLGDQGGYTTISGRLYGSTKSDLAAAMTNLIDFYDGNPHVLTDSMGVDFPYVKLENLEWDGDASSDATLGYTRRYTARFFHLTI